MTRLTFYITPKQKAALEALAKQTGLKVAELIRRFIDIGLTTRRTR